MRTLVVTCLVVLTIATTSRAAELSTLFPFEADVLVPAPGTSRLELPPELLSQCRADLSDVRLFGPSGEIPYAVDRGGAHGLALTVRKTATPKVTSAKHEQLHSKPVQIRETYLLEVKELPSEDAWELVFGSRRSSLVRTVKLSSDGWAQPVHATVFRLPKMNAENLRIALPALTAKPARITLVLEGEDEQPLEPSLQLESTHAYELRQVQATVPLALENQTAQKGKTVFDWTRPVGIIPSELVFSTRTPMFDRRLRVYDVSQTGAAVLVAEGRIFRLTAGGVSVERLKLPIGLLRADTVRIEVDDFDSPPLEALTVSVLVHQPALVFSAPLASTAQAPALVLRFGGGRAHLPRYDLTGLLPPPGRIEEDRREITARLWMPGVLPEASFSPVRTNPRFNASPALAFAMRPGSTVDATTYSHRRQVTLQPSSDGLSRLPLSPEDIALLRTDFADVRLVDANMRQWPFLLEEAQRVQPLPLSVSSWEKKPGTSRFTLTPPVSPLPISRVELDIEETFFQRPLRVFAQTPEGKEQPWTQGTLVREARSEGRPLELTAELTGHSVPVASLRMEVDNGEDAPLRLKNVRAFVPAPVLYVTAPAGQYWLLLGNTDAAVPRYEMASARPLVLSVTSGTAQVEAISPNPSFQKMASASSRRSLEKIALYAVLGIAALLLGALTLRMASSN